MTEKNKLHLRISLTVFLSLFCLLCCLDATEELLKLATAALLFLSLGWLFLNLSIRWKYPDWHETYSPLGFDALAVSTLSLTICIKSYDSVSIIFLLFIFFPFSLLFLLEDGEEYYEEIIEPIVFGLFGVVIITFLILSAGVYESTRYKINKHIKPIIEGLKGFIVIIGLIVVIIVDTMKHGRT